MKEKTNTRSADTSNGRIAIWDTGGEGPPVLFIHGNSSCKEVFRHQFSCDQLSKFRCLAFDLPGHGQSDDADVPSDAYNIPSYAQLAKEICHICAVDNPVVVGWSLGGHIGLEMIGQGMDLTGLAISGTPPCNPSLDDITAAFSPQPHMSFTGKEVFTKEEAETYARYTCGVNLPLDPILVAAVKRADGRARRIMWEKLTVQKEGCLQKRIVAETDTPIAVIQGEDEAFFDNDYLDTLQWKNRWRGKTVLVPGAGHAPFWEKPAEYNHSLYTFLNDLF